MPKAPSSKSSLLRLTAARAQHRAKWDRALGLRTAAYVSQVKARAEHGAGQPAGPAGVAVGAERPRSVHYYERNLGWTVISDAFPGETIGVRPQGKQGVRCKAFRLPDPSFEPSFEDFHAFCPGPRTAGSSSSCPRCRLVVFVHVQGLPSASW